MLQAPSERRPKTDPTCGFTIQFRVEASGNVLDYGSMCRLPGFKPIVYLVSMEVEMHGFRVCGSKHLAF